MEHSFSTASVPQPWYDGFVLGLFDALTERLLDDRFVGREIVLAPSRWSRTGVAAGTITTDSDVVEFELVKVPQPERLRLSGVSAEGRATWRASVDLVAWEARGNVKHRFALASFSALVADVDAARWAVVVRVDIEPKSWGRVLWPLARIFGYDRLRRGFAEALDELAHDWDVASADLLQRHPADAAETVVARAASRPSAY